VDAGRHAARAGSAQRPPGAGGRSLSYDPYEVNDGQQARILSCLEPWFDSNLQLALAAVSLRSWRRASDCGAPVVPRRRIISAMAPMYRGVS